MPPYINASEAQGYLEAFNIQHVPHLGALEAASDSLDAYGSFIGDKYGGDAQVRAFPRDETVVGDVAGQVPERVKKWVALQAYRLDTGEEPPVTSLSVPHLGSKTYARPRQGRASVLMRSLLSPYILRRATGLRTVPLERG